MEITGRMFIFYLAFFPFPLFPLIKEIIDFLQKEKPQEGTKTTRRAFHSAFTIYSGITGIATTNNCHCFKFPFREDNVDGNAMSQSGVNLCVEGWVFFLMLQMIPQSWVKKNILLFLLYF